MSQSAGQSGGTPVGLFYTWWRGNPLPELESLEGFSLEPTDDTELIGQLSDLTAPEASQRIAGGHQPYLALIHGEPVAYGWSAWRQAEIGELGIEFELPPGERYLWDFVTLPDWRGRGVYAHMLQGIIRAESTDAHRFWIGHDAGNIASARGIEKAGLPVVGEVWIREGRPVFIPRESNERFDAAARLLNVAVARQERGKSE